MDNKRFVVAVVGDMKMFDHILQSQDVGDGFVIKPHCSGITLHTRLSLFSHEHGTTVAFQAHAGVRARNRCHIRTIAKQIHRGLAVQ